MRNEARTVLVIDDVETVLAVTKRLLERLGFDVMTTASGLHGLKLAQSRNDLCAVILDGGITDISSDETWRRLVEIHPGIPVVIMTGGDLDDIRERFPDGALAAVIQKPFQPGVFEKALAPHATCPSIAASSGR